MAGFDPLLLGTTANDRTGDDFRAGGTKLNTMLEELFASADSIGLAFIKQESDFPVQDGSTITLESQRTYVVTAAISTTKRFIVEDGAVLTSFNILGPVLQYTGTGTMFTGIDATFTIRDIQIDHPNAQGFSFTDTVGGLFLYLNEKVRTVSGTKYGTFNNLQTVLIEGSSALDVDNGLTFTGTSSIITSVDKFFLQSTSATFIGLDLGSSIARTIEFNDYIAVGPPGSFGISGLINSGNVPVGRLAMVNNSEFSGGLTPLQNITNSDIRWNFETNTPIPDTIADALLSLTSNVTATVISTVDTPVLVTGIWVIERSSLYTGSVAGRITYIAERDLVTPIDISVQIEPVSGANKDVTVYLALNGTIITNSGKSVRADSGNPLVMGVIWQLNLVENDFLEVFVENNSDSVNIIVNSSAFRVR